MSPMYEQSQGQPTFHNEVDIVNFLIQCYASITNMCYKYVIACSNECYLLRVLESLVTDVGIFVGNLVSSSLSEDRLDTGLGVMDIFLEEGH